MQTAIAEDRMTVRNATPELQEVSQSLLNATIFVVDDEPMNM